MNVKTHAVINGVKYGDVVVDYDFYPEDIPDGPRAGIYLKFATCSDGADRLGDMTDMEMVELAGEIMFAASLLDDQDDP